MQQLDPILQRLLTPLKGLFRVVTMPEYMQSARTFADEQALRRDEGNKSVRLNSLEQHMLTHLMEVHKGVSFNDLFSHMLTVFYAIETGKVPTPVRLERNAETPPTATPPPARLRTDRTPF